MNGRIINSITRLHLVGYFYWVILRCTDPWILNLFLYLFIPSLFVINQCCNTSYLYINMPQHTIKFLCCIAVVNPVFRRISIWLAFHTWTLVVRSGQKSCYTLTIIILTLTKGFKLHNLRYEYILYGWCTFTTTSTRIFPPTLYVCKKLEKDKKCLQSKALPLHCVTIPSNKHW